MKKELIEKIHSAIIEMKKSITLDEKHMYTRNSDGKWLAGVSSIADLLPKEYLIPWAAKETVTFLGYDNEVRANEVIEKIRTCTPKEYQQLLEDAKKAHKNKSGQALIDGKAGHAYLELWVKAKIRGTEIPLLTDENLSRPVNQFIKWADENIKQWILSEALVVSLEEDFAGTLDALAITKEDKLAVIDFKFATSISNSYHLQTAGYSIPFEKYGIDIQDRIIIRLPKTLTRKIWDRKKRVYYEESNNIEIARSPFSMEYDKETFRHARQLYYYSNLINKG